VQAACSRSAPRLYFLAYRRGNFDWGCVQESYIPERKLQKPFLSFCQSGNATHIRFWRTRLSMNEVWPLYEVTPFFKWNIRLLEFFFKWALKSTVFYVVTDPPCTSEVALGDVIIKEAQWAFCLAKMAAWEEKYYYYRKSKYFYTKPVGALCRWGISKIFDECNIISTCACGAPTGKGVHCKPEGRILLGMNFNDGFVGPL